MKEKRIMIIWAFSISLLQASNKNHGNHPGILIFDEPKQQNVISKDVKSFLDTIFEFEANNQTILAMTLDRGTKEILSSYSQDSYHMIRIGQYAFIHKSKRNYFM